MVKRSRLPLIPLALLAVLAASVAVCRFAYRQTPAPAPLAPDASADSATSHSAASPSLASASSLRPDGIFRRAFWRHPGPADRIVHAERREYASSPGAEIDSWRWFLALHPSPELLRSLRDPETFGLTPTAAPHPWPTKPTLPPAWFPAPAMSANFEVLQASAGNFTILYRASDNLLYATDHGQGFTAPARPL